MQKTIRCRTELRGSSRRRPNEQSIVTRMFSVVVLNKSWFLAGSYKHVVFGGAPDCCKLLGLWLEGCAQDDGSNTDLAGWALSCQAACACIRVKM